MKDKELMEKEETRKTAAEAEKEPESKVGKEPEKERSEERDFDSEIRELMEKYPELAGRSLPNEVVQAALDGMDLTKAYEIYREERSGAEKERGGNGKTAMRAPVRGVSGGEAVRMQGEDDFLRGFNA